MDLAKVPMVSSGMIDVRRRFERTWRRALNIKIDLTAALAIIDRIEKRVGKPLNITRAELEKLDAAKLSATVQGLVAFYLATYGLSGPQLLASWAQLQELFFKHLPFLRK